MINEKLVSGGRIPGKTEATTWLADALSEFVHKRAPVRALFFQEIYRMYLNAIALTRTIPCLAEPGKIIVYGRPSRLITEVLPYLAALPSVIAYNPSANTLTFRRLAGFMTLYADKVFITKVANVEEGIQLLAALKDAINATWEHRDELVAATAPRRAPRHLDIYSLLPQTNCKQCGEASCLAFAVLLIQQKHSLAECIPLQQDPAFSDSRDTLEAML